MKRAIKKLELGTCKRSTAIAAVIWKCNTQATQWLRHSFSLLEKALYFVMFACLFVCFFPHRQENLLSFVSWCKSGANQSCKALKNLKIMCKLRPTGIFTTVLYFFPNEKFMNNISIVVKIIILTSSEIRSAIGHIAAMATVSFGIASFNRLIPFKYNVIKKLQMNAVIYLWFEIHMKWTLNAAPVHHFHQLCYKSRRDLAFFFLNRWYAS